MSKSRWELVVKINTDNHTMKQPFISEDQSLDDWFEMGARFGISLVHMECTDIEDYYE